MKSAAAALLVTVLFMVRKAEAEDRSFESALNVYFVLPVAHTTAKDHGLRQFDKMVNERPHMGQFLSMPGPRAEIVTPEDSISKWVIARFEGKSAGQPIYWTNHEHSDSRTDSQKGARSAFWGGHGGLPLSVTVSQDFQLFDAHASIFEESWRALIFELLNAENLKSFVDLQVKVAKNAIDRDDFLKESAKLEWSALSRLHQVYQEVWLPWCKSRGFKSEAKTWHVPHLDNFEKWFGQYSDPDGYPFSDYGPYYDSMRKWSDNFKRWHKRQQQSGK